MIDLRSDTVTKPTDAMRRAMAAAEVGDDVYGEDPTVRRLEERTAALLNKEAALFVPTGTMGNQSALLVHCQRGDEVIIGRGAHLYFHEGGAGPAWAGVQFVEVGASDGTFDAADVDAVIKPAVYHLPRTRLIAFENTHNRGGGRVFPHAALRAAADLARARGLAVHLDGARVWNAHIATGLSLAELAAPADTVNVCFSKGLGAPVGSALVGSRAHIDAARRFRRMLGGAMRQSGVLAAAALHALDHHLTRLVDDHANAQRLARGLSEIAGLACDPRRVETNIVAFEVQHSDAPAWVRALASHGVLVNAVGRVQIRAVTHLDVSASAIDQAIHAARRAAGEIP